MLLVQIEPVSTTPYWIDQTTPLFAIQHQPALASIKKTAVIILNSGFLHNVGPYRLHIDMANLISSNGFVVVRLDQSGKGDSPPRHDIIGKDARLLDYDETFERLRIDYGVSDCILVGLCSGADDALEIAELRESVSGLVLLDGFCPVTLRYYAHHYYTRFRHYRAGFDWKRRMRDTPKTNLESSAVMSLRRWQSEKDVKVMYEAVLKRGVKILAVFSGSTGDYYNHHGQLTLGLNAPTVGLREVYFHNATHIYSLPDHRNQLVEEIANWMQGQLSRR